MRKFALTLALIGMLAVPVFAQIRGGRGGFGSPLLNKSVQVELKLTDAQKADLKKIQDKNSEAMKEAFGSFKDDREKATELMKKAREATAKSLTKFKESLNTAQAKRLRQIELQSAVRFTSIKVFTKEDVAKDLKLTPKQKEVLAGAAKDLDADLKEIRESFKGGKGKRGGGGREKIAALNKKTLESFTKTLTADQKAAWKEMTGTPFEMKFEGFKGGKGGKGGKGKRKPKDDI